MTCLDLVNMADPNQQNPAPLLLFPTNDTTASLAPDVLRPVPATASLFPAEDGEADSFLGQTVESTPNQPAQPSQIPFFNVPPASSSTPSSDPFASVGHQSESTIPTGASFQSPAPPATHQSVSFASPADTPRTSQYFPSPSAPTGPKMAGQARPLDPSAPPPVGPPQGKVFTGGYNAKAAQKYRPMIHPMGGQTPSSSGSPYRPPMDPSRPPPMAMPGGPPHDTASVSGGPQSLVATSVSALGFSAYQPVHPHWFYCKSSERGSVWYPFSSLDSGRLEEALHSAPIDDSIISTNGGRYDVSLQQRLRYAIYWEEAPSIVRRCTWFYKSDGENRFLPYEEPLADKLEDEYKLAVMNNVWHKRLEFADGETIVMHNPNVIVHFRPSNRPDDFGTSSDGQMRPRVVKRGVEDVESIDQGEPNKIDHLVFVVHGIGPVCDFRFRGIVECVDELRSVSLGLLRSHFKHAQDDGRVGRTEFLPVYWYDALHGDATGVDRRLRRITLPSISRLRRFTNDTLLDILFYSSPTYSQKIAEQCSSETNRLYELFQERNPEFRGQVSIVGHSLGSLIAFDLLSHQGDSTTSLPVVDPNPSIPQIITDGAPESSEEEEETEEPSMTLDGALAQLGLTEFLPKFQEERIDMESLLMCSDADLKDVGLPMGPRKKLGTFLKEQVTKLERNRKAKEARLKVQAALAARDTPEPATSSSSSLLNASAHSVNINYEPGAEGVGQPFVQYSKLDFRPQCFFAVGSPIGMFLTVRGVSRVGEEYQLPTCDGFFNIFHPFDPVAYRMEPLVHPDMAQVKPFLMPHHKGRKRLHLELRESLTTFGTDLKRSLVDSMKRTWKSIHEFALAHRSGGGIEGEDVPDATSKEMEAVADKLSQEEVARQEREKGLAARELAPSTEFELQLGQLNGGRRIDYVLQEAPLESFNEYLFALSSHTCYWESEDTVLLILKEIYASVGVFPLMHGPKQDSAPASPATLQ